MKILYFVLITFFICPMNSEGIDNETFNLIGYVFEEDSGEPLTGALIILDGIEKQYYTDFEGYFSVNALKPGTYDIEISFASYETRILRNVHLDPHNNNLFVNLK